MEIIEWNIQNKIEELIPKKLPELLIEAEETLPGIQLPFFQEIHKKRIDPYSLPNPSLCIWVDSVSSDTKDRLVHQKHFSTHVEITCNGISLDKKIVLYASAFEQMIHDHRTLDGLCITAEVIEKGYQDNHPYREGFPVTVLLVLDIVMEVL